MYSIIDSQTLASIVAQMITQIITQQPPLSPSVINLLSPSLQAMTSAIHQSEKLSNTAEYNRDKDCLNV